jgi:hypothetical protein
MEKAEEILLVPLGLAPPQINQKGVQKRVQQGH